MKACSFKFPKNASQEDAEKLQIEWKIQLTIMLYCTCEEGSVFEDQKIGRTVFVQVLKES